MDLRVRQWREEGYRENLLDMRHVRGKKAALTFGAAPNWGLRGAVAW
jgi:hypothetical protein